MRAIFHKSRSGCKRWEWAKQSQQAQSQHIDEFRHYSPAQGLWIKSGVNTDYAGFADYYPESAKRAVERGIVTGVISTTLQHSTTCTQAQINHVHPHSNDSPDTPI